MFRRSMIGVSVEDVEKRRLPSKHYVYVIYVTWNDGSLNVIYRRYSRFFELQTKILDKFPEEAGSKDPTRRIIPFLPGKILFGRSHIREVALKRLQSINQYCKALVKLPAHISECDEVLAFFETSPEDLLQHSKTIERKPSERKGKQISHPLLLDQYVATADYEKMGRNEVSLQTGQRVEVVEKTEVGWWFVSTDEGQGWVPSSHLEKEDGSQENRIVHEASPGEEERFVVIETYIPMAVDEIRIDKGGFVQVVERNLDGWWLVRYQGNEGRVPATNLTKADTLKMNRVTSHVTAPPVEVIPNLMSISSFNRQKLDRLVSATSSNEGRGNKPESPTKPLIDFDSPPSSAGLAIRSSQEQSHQGTTDENFNPLFRKSQRKCPPPRKNSVSMVAPPRPAPPAIESVYVAIADLSVSVDDGVSLTRGQVVSVLEKTETGWWYVSAGGDRGWAPVSYITKRHQAKKDGSKPPRPGPPPAKILPAASSSAMAQDSVADGLASLAAVLQGSKTQQQPSTAVISQAQATAAVATVATASVSDQLYQNVDDEDTSGEGGRFVAAYPFEGVEVGEVRLDIGDIVDVLGRNVSGWWYVRVVQGSGRGEGWVPSSFLRPADSDAESNISAGQGVYSEVSGSSMYDDFDSIWSDSTSSSPAASAGPSPAHTVSTQGATAATSALAPTDSIGDNIPPHCTGFYEEGTALASPRQRDGFADINRLSNYMRSSLRGGPPTIPPKKSKDFENSQQKLGRESKSDLLSLKSVQKQSSSEEIGFEKKNDDLFALPLASSHRPMTATKPAKNTQLSSVKLAVNEKPSLPIKKVSVSRAAGKTNVPDVKPDIAAKPAPTSGKPNLSSYGSSKPGIGPKPAVKSLKPVIPQSKPKANKNFDSSSTKAGSSQMKPGSKVAWPPDEQGAEAGDDAASANPKPTKVQDLAKLFGS